MDYTAHMIFYYEGVPEANRSRKDITNNNCCNF